MADQRDNITEALMGQQNTGGLSQQDFNTFSTKLNDPAALQGWLDKGGIYGQWGGTPPDPDEQYFANRGLPSGSISDIGWMASLQPWQQGGQAGGETTYMSQNQQRPGWIGGGSMTRADPSYWGWQGPHQGYAPGSMGDISGLNGGGGGGGSDGRGGGGGPGRGGGYSGGGIGSDAHYGNQSLASPIGEVTRGYDLGPVMSQDMLGNPTNQGVVGMQYGDMLGPTLGAPAGFGNDGGFTNDVGVSGEGNQGGFY
jgi:hypothetical protein